MNQERWKELVQQEASRTQWQAVAVCFALASMLLMLVSMASGWGDPWLFALGAGVGSVIWVFEKVMHRGTVRTLEDMAGMAARRGGIEV